MRSSLVPIDPAAIEHGDCFSDTCPARELLAHVTGRWGSLVLAALRERTHRFSELRVRIGGISEKMLAQTLRELERDGFVSRRSYPQVPPRVEYSLTAAGREISGRVTDVIVWLQEHVRDLVTAQNAFDRRDG